MADRLDLLLALDMTIVIVDAVYDEVTSDLRYPNDRGVKAFIEGNMPPFAFETTDIGTLEREKRAKGAKLKRNAGEVAMADFMSSDDGLRRYVNSGDPFLLLFEDAGFRVFSKPPNLHLLSTVGLLRGLERVGAAASRHDNPSSMAFETRQRRSKCNDRGIGTGLLARPALNHSAASCATLTSQPARKLL